MASRQLDEERIFHTARQLPSPEAKADYLDQICAGDQPLRERVEALLAVHEREHDFLKSAQAPAATLDQPAISEAPGQQTGRFKLLQEIGEGGFGVVYMAEQTRPVRRKVDDHRADARALAVVRAAAGAVGARAAIRRAGQLSPGGRHLRCRDPGGGSGGGPGG